MAEPPSISDIRIRNPNHNTNNPNASPIHADDINDPLFRACWRRQSCQYCLQGDVACSWCPISSTCIPNPSIFPILTPLNSSTICPLGDKERWELRATPFGCDVSTITFLTCVVTVLSTLVAVGLLFVGACVGKRVVGWSREGKFAEWRDEAWTRGVEGIQGIQGIQSIQSIQSIFGRGDGGRMVSDDEGGSSEDVDYEERRPLLG